MLQFEDGQVQGDPSIRKEDIYRISRYVYESAKPEREFYDGALARSHSAFVQALKKFSEVSGVQRVPDGSGFFVVSVKRGRYVPDYDARYRAQLKAIMEAAEPAWEAWRAYIRCATLFQQTNSGYRQDVEANLPAGCEVPEPY